MAKLTILTLLALSGACTGEGPSAPQFGAATTVRLSANVPVSRPSGGTCTTNIHSAVLQPTAFVMDMTGQCILQHLGRTTMVIHQECYFDGSCVNATTHTAANGDILRSTWYSAPGQNTFDGLHAVFEGTETYVGGTGRFEGASGSSFVSGTADIDLATGGFTGRYTTSGTITY